MIRDNTDMIFSRLQHRGLHLLVVLLYNDVMVSNG